MRLSLRIRIQLVIFIVVTLVAASIMLFGYMQVPARLFGIGQYTVTVELPRAAGLYKRANVTYRGTEIGRVTAVHLTDTGVSATLSLDTDISIPADVEAEVHSQSAIGEQYVALLPRSGNGPPLKDGSVIPVDRTTIPPDISALLAATNRGLRAIPHDNLNTVINESFTAVGGLGSEIARIVDGSATLAIDARQNLDPFITVIDESKPILDSQVHTADSIDAWASHLATISAELQTHDSAVTGILNNGPAAADEVRGLLDRLQPTLPILLANLVSIGDVALTYQPSLEQLLVLVPQVVAEFNAILVPDMNTKMDYKGAYIDFALNLNLPPPCTTGYLPIQQQRPPAAVDYPDRPAGDLYCRIPQDSPLNVRGMRNLPCVTRPGKRAPTVKMCESDENYVPLNDGFNWKGDPNATLSGQDIPQLPPGSPPAAAPSPPPAGAPPPIAVAQYDPATGTYTGPDGRQYTQSDLGQTAPKDKTWQNMLLPPGN